MNLFDAVAHAFSTVSTAGFSPYDASLAHFDSIGVEAVATVFMFLGGASFALHFTVLKRRDVAALLARHRVQGLLPARSPR